MRSQLPVVVVIASLVSISHAQAEPLRPLTRDEVTAAAEAAEALLAPVDKKQADRCRAKPQPTDAAGFAALADCYLAAGSLGRALVMWQYQLQKFPTGPEVAVTLAKLGHAFERAGRFVKAARYYVKFARKYPRHKGAPEQMVRGVCMLVQLGRQRDADKGLKYAKRFKQHRSASDTAALCGSLRPIVVPGK